MTITSNTPIDNYDLSGGINTVSSALALKSSECRDSQDVDYFPIGGISKRNGYTLLGISPYSTSASHGLYMARYSTAGGTNIAYMTQGTKLLSMSSALGGTWADSTNGLTITAGQNNIWNFAMLNDICVAGNGLDTPFKINSSAVASVLTSGAFTPTNFKFCAQSRGYMWYFVPTVAGVVQYDRGYFSDLGDPTTVGANNFINIHKGQGGDVRGAIEFKTYFYVWKRHGIHQLIFQPTQVDSSGNTFPWVQNPNPIVPGVGTQSHRSIVKFTTPATHATPGEEYVFFVDQFGSPRIFDGATTLSFSSKIGFSRDTLIKSLSNMDTTRTQYAFSINYPMKNKILCFMSEINSQQNVCWVLDYSTGFSIGRYKFNEAMNVGDLFEKSDGTFKPFVSGYTGNTFELDKGTTDNGGPINDYWVGPDHFYKSPAIRTSWPGIEVRGKTGSSSQKIKLSYYIDGDDTPGLTITPFSLQDTQTLWGSSQPMTWGVSSWAKTSFATKSSDINVLSKTLRTRIESNDKTNDTWSIEGYTLWADPRGKKQS